MRKTLLFFSMLGAVVAMGQDFNARVTVKHNQITTQNIQVFKNMETSILEFINNRKWAEMKIDANERIDINMVLNITEFDNVSNFRATLTLNASRPVYGSTYNTVILNHEDNDFQFSYVSFQQMNYNDQTFTNNFTSVLGFYMEIILGMTMDSYSLLGGSSYLTKANNVMIAAQSAGQPGWNAQDGSTNKNRYYMIDDLTSDRFKDMRRAMYTYHRKGLDIMSKDLETGRNEITVAIKEIQKVAKMQPNSMWLKVFF
ncbi:MAG: type IX secretion system protein PorD, partial [Bacteroidia bacterium]